MTLKLECLTCEGAGGASETGTCATCKGTGDAAEGTPDPYCEPCSGDGFMHDDRNITCEACKGSGYKASHPMLP